MKLQKSTSNCQLVLGLISLKYISNNFLVKANVREQFYMHDFLRQTYCKSFCIMSNGCSLQFSSFHSWNLAKWGDLKPPNNVHHNVPHNIIVIVKNNTQYSLGNSICLSLDMLTSVERKKGKKLYTMWVRRIQDNYLLVHLHWPTREQYDAEI